MIWAISKRNHKLSIRAWVRRWLGADALRKFLMVFTVQALLVALWLGARVVVQLTTPEQMWFGSYQPSPVAWLAALMSFLAFWPFPLYFFDKIVDGLATRGDIATLEYKPEVMLATRAEYIGGHPQLPHGRFVYVTLGGTLDDPRFDIRLPASLGKKAEVFSMPVLDFQRTTQLSERTGSEANLSVTLVNVTFRTKLLGENAILNVEYIGGAGRKHMVQLGHFFRGNGEVQNWHNHIVCLQAEAETGERPHKPWEELPPPSPGAQTA